MSFASLVTTAGHFTVNSRSFINVKQHQHQYQYRSMGDPTAYFPSVWEWAFIPTLCFLFYELVNQLLIHKINCPLVPWLLSFLENLWWRTLSTLLSIPIYLWYWIHPHKVTSWPIWAERNSPQVLVRVTKLLKSWVESKKKKNPQ